MNVGSVGKMLVLILIYKNYMDCNSSLYFLEINSYKDIEYELEDDGPRAQWSFESAKSY